MTRPSMKPRTIRVPDKLWDAALTVAAARDETLAEEIRRMVREYVEKGDGE